MDSLQNTSKAWKSTNYIDKLAMAYL